MHVQINGAPITLNAQTYTIADILHQHGFAKKMVAVAVNGQFVAKSNYKETCITNGDSIEIVAPMQGG